MLDDQSASFEDMFQNDTKLKVFNDTVPAGILVLRVDDGKVIFSNRVFNQTLGIDDSQAVGGSWTDYFVDADERQELMLKFVVDDEVRNEEVRLKHKDGGVVWGLASISNIPIKDEDLMLFAFIDVTPLKKAEAEIQNLANYDALTKLPSRRLFSDRLHNAIERARRADGKVALLFIDLDDFKAVNDTLGHEAGDFVLVEVGKRLRKSVRRPDTVARIGGDEFVAIVDIEDIENATEIAQRIVSSISQVFDTKDGAAHISASIGVSVFPKDGSNEEELLKSADEAMYRTKNDTKSGYTVA